MLYIFLLIVSKCRFNSGANVTSSDLNNIKVYNKHNNVTDTHCSIPNIFSGNWQGLIDRVDIRIQSKNSLSVLLKFYFVKNKTARYPIWKSDFQWTLKTIVNNGRNHYAMSTWAQISDSKSKMSTKWVTQWANERNMSKAESKWAQNG